MPHFLLKRPRVSEWRDRLTPLVLALAMFVALLALGGDRGYFYRWGGIHSWNSAQTLAIAENLSPRRNFRLATRVSLNESGDFEYGLYSRFPVGGFALVKLATMPFGDDLAVKLIAARVLMLLMFCAAAALSCISITRLTGSRPTAVAATLLAFSGFYALYYADSVLNEGVMDLFGAALTFHGMVVFVQEGRFRQLLVKTCAALFIGWHVYGLLPPFIALGLGGEAVALLRSAVSWREKARIPYARSAIIALARSRFVALAAVAILFGSALLALNIVNDYASYGGGGVSETPTFRSALGRLGVRTWGIEWDSFLERQLYRVGAMSAPYALAREAGYDFPIPEPFDPPFIPTAFGVAATIAALTGLAFVRRYRMLAATAVLFGFCWAILLRHNTYNINHVFEGLPYIGLALALFTLALIGARRLLGSAGGGGAAIAAAAIAAPIFALSVFHAGQIDRDADEAERGKSEMADFSAIIETARGERVRIVWHLELWASRPWYAPGQDWRFWMRYYLAGSYTRFENACSPDADKGFAVARYRDDSLNPLTPENRSAFLYGETSPLDLCRAERRRLESSEPAARAVFDVYIQDNALSFLKAPCEPRDYEAPFYAHAFPLNPNDLPAEYRLDGFHPTANPMKFADLGAAFDGACLMTAILPDYPIAAVRTGQWLPGVERLWEVFAIPPLDGEALAFYEKTYQATAASGEPAARSGFDLYLDGDTLSYLKEPCGESDARGRVFLSVHPTDVSDLPPDRRAIGHDSLNFDFAPPSLAIFNGKCMATRHLPDYDIDKIQTGQWIPGGERLWDAEIVVSD